MISVTEIRRQADVLEVQPAVVDHDYVMGCFLHYLGTQAAVQQSLVFKGGTSLRKCYFEEYRFSEDLDFTATSSLSAAGLRTIIDEARNLMDASLGIQTGKRDVVIQTIADDYGKESYEVKIYYEGPLAYGGTPRSMRVHVSRDERLLFPAKIVPLIHSYSDKKELPQTSVRVYALEEIISEKLRAFSGQRKWAVARDVYDLYMLSKSGADIESAIAAFPQKCLAKRIINSASDLSNVVQRQAQYEKNWHNNLEYLIPANMKITFEDGWGTSIELLRKALGKV